MSKKRTGALIASVVAGLVMAGQVASVAHATEGKVKCSGVNECKGKGACKSADNACAGANGCKGKGWIEVGSEKECTDKGGTVVK